MPWPPLAARKMRKLSGLVGQKRQEFGKETGSREGRTIDAEGVTYMRYDIQECMAVLELSSGARGIRRGYGRCGGKGRQVWDMQYLNTSMPCSGLGLGLEDPCNNDN